MSENTTAPSNNSSASARRFVNAECTAIFNVFSSVMRLGTSGNGFGGNYATLNLSPVYAEMKGKRNLQAGDRIYNYDESSIANLSPENLLRLKYGVEAVERGDVVDCVVSLGNDREVYFSKLDIINGAYTSDGFYLNVRSVRDNKTFEVDHIMPLESIEIGRDMDEKPVLAQVNLSFELFKKWMEKTLDWCFSAPDYGSMRTKQVMAFSPSSAGSRPTNTEATHTLGRRRGTTSTGTAMPAEAPVSNSEVADFIGGAAEEKPF